MTQQPEFILCAAIYINDGIEHKEQPENITTGFIIAGRRHCNCWETLKLLSGDTYKNHLKSEANGFITSYDRFVSRKEGYKIAKEMLQIIHDTTDDSNPILVSEDLY